MNIGISISAYSNSDTPTERYQIIERCLDSLSEIKKKYNIYINIVNDTITETHKKILDKYDFPIINNPFNMGIAYTKNMGSYHILEQGLDYGILMDDDIIITDTNIIEKYYNAIKKTGFDHISMYIFKESDHNVQDFIYKGVRLKRCPTVNGCFLTFSRESIARTGYFNILPYKIGHEHSNFTFKNVHFGVIPFLVDIKESKGFDTKTIIDDTYDTSTYSHDPLFCERMFNENVRYVPKYLYKNVFVPIKDNIVKYYINLERSPDRRISMEKNFPEAFRIEAIDGLKLSEYKDIIVPEQTDCNTRELGCILSHIRVIISAYKNDFPGVLVMEDDLLNPYELKWKKSLRRVIDERPSNCDCVIINSNNIEVYSTDEEYVKWRKGFWGTACYWLSRKGIRKLYEKYIDINMNINLNNYNTDKFHQADMGILYESVDAYNYTTPLYRFLDGENLIRDKHHLEDSKINKLCGEIYTTI